MSCEQASPARSHARDSWGELGAQDKLLLQSKLRGLYGFDGSDAEIFDRLDLNKQRALCSLASRFAALDLWRHVRRITNVYGEGGVGCELIADQTLESALVARNDFTARFARHANAEAGHLERRRPRGSLHLLLMNRAACSWSAHFDAHSPIASPLSTLRHLWHERLRGKHFAWHELEESDGGERRVSRKQK